MSEDFTRGYGPVEYLIKHACSGKYDIFAQAFHVPIKLLFLGVI